ncbi:site-specific recombinase [Methyloversatilis sp.]|uniref:site-specific recombinase n=1 Tax=Methyloversatilis sp. TaxID=2569862 RepID=UPI0027328428|nr:site-specific recombinase [Methyloversatilis sp.]MDP2867230.1 site-specific recombinase [Methyloversatilis sp.]MDP3457073.1 site-specific recombinase [Methyloversatilis sp.]MDP3578893.1 site-specific recombinase [Methyloversatilis sp.]
MTSANNAYPSALLALLEDAARHPDDSSGDRLTCLVALLRPHGREGLAAAESRFHGLLRLLASRPDLAAALSHYLKTVLLARMHRTLYSESGVLANQGFFSGLISRVLGRMLPPAINDDFLRDLFSEVFDASDDGEWMVAIPREDWETLFERLDLDGEAFAAARRQCRHELFEAMRMASHRLAALGMEPALLRYMPALARHESPFLAQSDEVRELIRLHAGGETPQPYDGHFEVLLDQCSSYIDTIRRRSREAGVGVNLVFLLARIEQIADRLRLLRTLALPDEADDRPALRARAIDFFLRLVQQENRRNSLRDLFTGTTQLLARRVTEQASRSGEHYVTGTRSEFVAMFRAAAGAGVIIGTMAMIKILISKLGLPPVWEAVAYSLDYGLGFVLIHILHLTIATKQPAMTAATLAAALDGQQSRDARLGVLVELAAQVSRTQWISIAGNVSIGFIMALSIAMTAGQFIDWHPVDPVKGAHLLHDLHPWQSLALVHAAIAGIFLFLSGLISGYYDNQSLYHRVPERLLRVKWLRSLLGEARLARFARYIELNLGALAGNFLFGCMLGSTPVIGSLLGLPLDIRHVAFASANLAYGLEALSFDVDWHAIAIGALGVVLIGLTNLTVSFSLAMRVALRSRGIQPDDTRGLSVKLARRFLTRPRDFFWPPKDPPAEAEQLSEPGR